ncbi:MAG: GNAT family N-acetyltransferase [Pseudomonadota bacterium]
MAPTDHTDLIEVDAQNVDQHGFFCLMSRRKSPGWQAKRAWLDARFAEGMKIRLLGGGKRGFIETIPAEHCWRAINASGYLAIHCVWVVGRSKGEGLGRKLLDSALADAKAGGFKGVVMLTSDGNWLASPKFLAHHGFETVETSYPPFSIMLHKFDATAPDPTYSGDFDKRIRASGSGLTVIVTGQCPYLADAVAAVETVAEARGLPIRIDTLHSAEDVRARAPSPYGVFAILADGKLVSYCYQTAKDLNKILDKLGAG